MAPNPLHNADAERALLGCVLSDSSVLEEVATGVRPEDFADGNFGDVFAAMLALHRRRTPIDHITLSEELKARDKLVAIGGPAALMGLDLAIPLAANAAEYAKTIRDLAARRAIVQTARQIAARASSFDVEASAVAMEGAGAFASLGANTAAGLKTMADDIFEMLDELDAVAKGERVVCLPTGIDVWDELMGGLQAGVITFVGAQPGVGKSALIARIVDNLADAGHVVGLFSLEDRPTWLPYRLAARDTGVPVQVLKTKPLSRWQQEKVGTWAEQTFPRARRVVVDGRPRLTPAQVAATAQEMILKHGAKAIFVDHLGEMDVRTGRTDRFDLDVAEGVSYLRDIAKQHNVPVLVCAHFQRPRSQSQEDPKHQRPTSTSWANSASIERMARVAVGLWLDKGEPDFIAVSILKQTNGKRDIDFLLAFDKPSGVVKAHGGICRDGERGYDQSNRQEVDS